MSLTAALPPACRLLAGALLLLAALAKSPLQAATLDWTFDSQVVLEFEVNYFASPPFIQTQKIGRLTGTFTTDGNFENTTGSGVHEFKVQQFNSLFWDEDISDGEGAVNLADIFVPPGSQGQEIISTYSAEFHWDQQQQAPTTAPLTPGGSVGPTRLSVEGHNPNGAGGFPFSASEIHLAFEQLGGDFDANATSFRDILDQDPDISGTSYAANREINDFLAIDTPYNSTTITPVPEPKGWLIAFTLVAIPAIYARRRNPVEKSTPQ